MKKILSIMCAAACLLSLAGCGNNTSTTDSGTSSTTSTVSDATSSDAGTSGEEGTSDEDDKSSDAAEESETTSDTSDTSDTSTTDTESAPVDSAVDLATVAIDVPADISTASISKTDTTVTVFMPMDDFCVLSHYIWEDPSAAPISCVAGFIPNGSTKTLADMIATSGYEGTATDFIERDGMYLAESINVVSLPVDSSLAGVYEVSRAAVEIMTNFGFGTDGSLNISASVGEGGSSFTINGEEVDVNTMPTKDKALGTYTVDDIMFDVNLHNEECISFKLIYDVPSGTETDDIVHPEISVAFDGTAATVDKGGRGVFNDTTGAAYFSVLPPADFEELTITLDGDSVSYAKGDIRVASAW